MKNSRRYGIIILTIGFFFMGNIESSFALTKSIGRIARTNNGGVDRNNVTINMYPTATSNQSVTYINHGYIDDVPIIDENGQRVKVEVNGCIGWIDKNDENGNNIFQVPLNKAKNLSYYKKSYDGTLKHYISSDITSNRNKGFTINVGKAPMFMEVDKKYYSYDSVYFYDSIEKLLNNYKNNTKESSVNILKPYYNYYTNLPGRSKTTYSVNEINRYINNNTPNNSVLRNKGQAFIEAQNKYGVNAALILGVAMNESGKGTSNIARTKNNIFGLNAIDSDTGQANKFVSVEACIKDFAKNWMSSGYFNPKDWRYNGSFLGNKSLGINVRYASDPFWGEKAASYAYGLDKYISNGNLRDYDQYYLGKYIKNNTVEDDSNKILYDIKSSRKKSGKIGDIVVINNKVNDKYEINPDRQSPISSSLNSIYNWNEKGYIYQNGVEIINKPQGEWIYKDGEWYHYDKNYNIKTGWINVDGIWYYMNSYGQMVTGWIQFNNNWYHYNSDRSLSKGWIKTESNWYYANEEGVRQTGWINVNGTWYYMNSYGQMVTGWVKFNNKWYHYNSDRSLSKGWVKTGSNWYYTNEDGARQTGWINDGGNWYYLNSSGQMVTGWIKFNNKWYHYNSDRSLSKGWVKTGSNYYYTNKYGVRETGWIKTESNWYHTNSNGIRQTGWINVNGTWYYMNSYGQMVTGWIQFNNNWYHYNSDRSLSKGWVKTGSNWCYTNEDGVRQTGWINDGGTWYYLNSSGQMVTGKLKFNNKWYQYSNDRTIVEL